MEVDPPEMREIGSERTAALVQRAKSTRYYAELVAYLSRVEDDPFPEENTVCRAFERGDLEVVAITTPPRDGRMPRIGLTFNFEGGTTTLAVAERHENGERSILRLIYPEPFAPNVEEERSGIERVVGEDSSVRVERPDGFVVFHTERSPSDRTRSSP
jgi:hypothetical protein